MLQRTQSFTQDVNRVQVFAGAQPDWISVDCRLLSLQHLRTQGTTPSYSDTLS